MLGPSLFVCKSFHGDITRPRLSAPGSVDSDSPVITRYRSLNIAIVTLSRSETVYRILPSTRSMIIFKGENPANISWSSGNVSIIVLITSPSKSAFVVSYRSQLHWRHHPSSVNVGILKSSWKVIIVINIKGRRI